MIVAFDDLVAGCAASATRSRSPTASSKKLVSPIEWPLPQHFAAYRHVLPGRQEPAARHDRRDVAGKLRDAAGAVRRHASPTSSRPRTCPARCRSTSTPGTTPRLQHAEGRPRPHLSAMPLSARPASPTRAAKVGTMFGGEVMQHLEFLRINGLMTASGIPVIRYTTPERHLRDHRRLRGLRHHDRQPACRDAGGRQPLQARRCRPARLQAGGRSDGPAQSGQDAKLRATGRMSTG